MNIKEIRSDIIYRQIIKADKIDKINLFRDKLMAPFEFKYKCIGVPLQAEMPGGYDVVSANVAAGGYDPATLCNKHEDIIERINKDTFCKSCKDSMNNVLEGFTVSNIKLPVEEYIYTILLNDPDNPMTAYTGKTCGDGGIPGYIIGTIVPDTDALEAMPAVLAHEMNHNVRWQFMKWNKGITLADY